MKPRMLYNAVRHIKGHFDPLIKAVNQHIDDMYSGVYHEDNDDEHFIYEVAMKTVYGNDIFKKINEILANRNK